MQGVVAAVLHPLRMPVSSLSFFDTTIQDEWQWSTKPVAREKEKKKGEVVLNDGPKQGDG